MDRDELLRQIADHTSDPSFVLGLSQLPNPDEVLRKAGLSHQVYDQVLTDPHVMSKVIDRRAGLLRREWQVKAGGDAAGDLKAVALCEQAVADLEEHEEYPLENSLGILQEAALRGHRALEVVWRRTGNSWLPEFLRDIPNRRLIHTGVQWRLLTIDAPSHGIDLPQRKVLLATHMASTDNPYGEALLSRCYWPYLFKHNGLKWWVTLAEKYGLPWIIAMLGGQTEEAQRRELLSKLVAMAVDPVTVLPKGAEVDFKLIEGVSPDVHDRLIRISNAEISKVLVGQTLSTEMDGSSGSRAAAETHSGLRDEIVEADGKLVARVMNRLFAWITELNLGPTVTPPKFVWIEEYEPPREWSLIAARAIRSLPGKVPLRWAYDKFGIGEEYREDQDMVAPLVGGGGEAGADFARDDAAFTPQQEALEALAEKSAGAAGQILAENEKKLLDVVENASSYEEAMERLLDVYPELATEDLEDLLARTLTAATLYGRYTAGEEAEEDDHDADA
jgi:phage gp29-like protein